MADYESVPAGGPPESTLTLTHVIYGLHALSILIGLSSTVAVVSAFVFGLPSILAVILNYLNQAAARGTYLESHFRWQIRTFWFALMWIALGVMLVLTVIGILVAWIVFFGAGIWVIYRVARGWTTLADRKPMPLPGG